MEVIVWNDNKRKYFRGEVDVLRRFFNIAKVEAKTRKDKSNANWMLVELDSLSSSIKNEVVFEVSYDAFGFITDAQAEEII